MEKLKIVVCSTSIAAYDRRMQRICLSLDRADYSVQWISRNSDTKFNNSSIDEYPISPWFKKGFGFYASFNILLFIKLLFSKFDYLYAVDLDTLMACRLVGILKSKPVVFDAHEYFSEVPELSGRHFVRSIWKKIGRIFTPGCVLRYTVTESLAERLAADYKCDFQMVRNCPNATEALLHDNSDSKKHIVYLGVLNTGRGLVEMIDALHQLDYHYSLLLMGEGDISQALRMQVTELNLSDRVEFLGMVRPENVQAILQKAWCGINLLDRRSESYYLSLANKTFDYIQAELPAVSSSFPEYQKLNQLHETMVLLDELSPSSIIDAIKTINDSTTYNRLKANCKQAKMLYNWENESKHLISLWQKLIT